VRAYTPLHRSPGGGAPEAALAHFYRAQPVHFSIALKEEVGRCIRAFVEQQKSEVVELNVQHDHVHLLTMVPPKVSISDYVGIIKGRTAIRVFNKFRELKHRPYWGNHFWSRGYCVDTVGLDEEKIRRYVKYQERRERIAEQRQLKFK
jgi:putative transposase